MRHATPFRQLREEMDRLWGALAPLGGSLVGRQSFPAVNVWETESDVWAEAELPGVSQNELEINVVGNELSLRGERKTPPTDGLTYHRQERSVGTFRRVLQLPVEIDSDKVEASLKDGVLAIRMPKAERAKPRKVQVSVA